MTWVEDALSIIRKIEQLAQDANTAIPAVVMVRAFTIPSRAKSCWFDGMFPRMAEKCGGGLGPLSPVR